ncbi:hypothetical protein WJS89_10650 [Sphingomicrobium sp. XHP0235]|uniref:hypothetical protein n=1 Tax=Sphingomicrobium aquimarinum TaxID=3133971 RepID=UPI0031FF19ED
MTASAANCATLIPDNWRTGVEGAELPYGDTVGEWVAFSDAQTGKLDQANDRQAATMHIIEKCEELERQAITPRKKVLGIF